MKLYSRRASAAFVLALLLIFALNLFFLMSPGHGEKVTPAYIAPLTVALALFALLRGGLPKMAETRLAVAFALWYPVTCVLNGDYYLMASANEVYPMLLAGCVLFPTAFLLNAETRRRFLTALAWLYGVVMSVIAWVAVVAAIAGRPVENPFNTSILGVNWIYSKPSYRLNVFDMHPNFSACLFYVALALLIWLMLSSRRKWVCAPLLALCVGLYCAISLTVSNTAILIVSLMLALLVFAAALGRKAKSGANAKRVLAAVLAAVVVAGATYASFPLSLRGMNAIASRVQSSESAPMASVFEPLMAKAAAEAATATSADNASNEASNATSADGASADASAADAADVSSDIAADPSEEAVVFAEPRADDTTLQSRFKIYASAIPSIQKHPRILLFGQTLETAMEIPRKELHYTELYHMHNSFLQALMVGGLPAMLMMLAFCALMAVRIVRLYFCPKATLAQKMLVLAPVGLFCHGMLEAYLFIDGRLPNLLFFLLCGFVAALTTELCPWRKVDQTVAQARLEQPAD